MLIVLSLTHRMSGYVVNRVGRAAFLAVGTSAVLVMVSLSYCCIDIMLQFGRKQNLRSIVVCSFYTGLQVI